MTTAQVTLTDDESQALQSLSQIKGVAPEVLLHEAVESYLVRHKSDHRLTSLRQARGIWSQRHDLPDPTELRREWDRPYSRTFAMADSGSPLLIDTDVLIDYLRGQPAAVAYLESLVEPQNSQATPDHPVAD